MSDKKDLRVTCAEAGCNELRYRPQIYCFKHRKEDWAERMIKTKNLCLYGKYELRPEDE